MYFQIYHFIVGDGSLTSQVKEVIMGKTVEATINDIIFNDISFEI